MEMFIVEDLRYEGDIISCITYLHNRMVSVCLYIVLHILRLREGDYHLLKLSLDGGVGQKWFW